MSNKVLLPIDLAQESSWTQALPIAASMVDGGGELHVVTVIPEMGMSLVGSFMPKDAEAKALEMAKNTLKGFLEDHAPNDLVVKGHVTKGTIYQEIIRAADKLGCDLIVMAAHRAELQDYLLGPNAAKVARHAKQSVYLVRG